MFISLTIMERECRLNSCFLCRYCLPQWKDLVALKRTTLVFKKGKKIFREGDPVKGIFFVYEGIVKVSASWEERRELILRFAKAGDVLGYRGFGGNLLYPITATALEDCKLCFIDTEFLESSLVANPYLTYQLMQVYAHELQKAEKRMRDLAHMEVRERIAFALFEISKAFGTDDNKFISLAISRQDIASFAGTSYETVFKFLTALSNNNIISTSGKNIRINDPEALQAFAKAPQ